MRLLPTVATCLVCVAAWALDEDYKANSPQNQRPMLGIEMTPVPMAVQDREGLTPYQGVYVQQVYNDTAAAAMGLKPGDVITAVNGVPIGSMSDLRNEIMLSSVGEKVDVTVARAGRPAQIGSELKPWPASIPYEKLDPAAERRFREFQERRQARQAEELAQLRRDLQEAGRRLAGEEPAGETGGAGAAGAGGADPAPPIPGPAFRLRHAILARADGPAQTDGAGAVFSDCEPAWRCRILVPAPFDPRQ